MEGSGRFRPLWSALIVCVMILVVGVSASHAITVNVVDGNGAAIAGGFRWMLEEDTTHLTMPGVPVNDSIGLAIHNSYAPVALKGHSTGDTVDITLPDASKRYFLSILPDSGYSNSGAAVPKTGDPDFNGTTINVVVHAFPIPTAQISLFAFVDQRPINNAWDEGEPGLGGATVLLFDEAGPMLTDAFGNPLGTIYDDVGDISSLGSGVLTTCTPAEVTAWLANPDIFTQKKCPKLGDLYIRNIAPGKYGVRVVPPGTDSAGAAIEWIQTTTIEGTPTIDAWVKANEPAIFVEGFGTGVYHVMFGFVKTSAGEQTFMGQTVGRTPWNEAPPAGGTGTITGRLVFNHFSRPPQTQGFHAGAPVGECWIGLNDPIGQAEVPGPGGTEIFTNLGLYAAPCNADSTFTIPNVPPGTYQFVAWDKPLDALFFMRNVIVPAGGGTVNLGDVLMFRWFGTFEGSVFSDVDQDGFRDPNEPGIIEQNINIRFRDGSIYQAQPTDGAGEYQFAEVFPFFKWLVVEVDFARFKATGMTAVVDDGGAVLPDNGWAYPSGDVLTPQPQLNPANYPMGAPVAQAAINNPNTGNNLSRTETGPVLTQAMHLFLNQTNIIDWGKTNYAAGENGGISGVIVLGVTRAEANPRYAAAEPWEPGIPRVQVALYEDNLNNATGQYGPDGIIDDLDASGGVTLADVDNYPFGNFPGPEDIDRNSNTIFDLGDAVDVTTSDSWDDAKPEGCRQILPVVHGMPVNECADAFHTWNQIRPGIFDGGYAFGPNLPFGTYIVEAAMPPGYEILKEEDKNVDFGIEFTPGTLLLPPVCVGTVANGQPLHVVPAELTLFPGVATANPGATTPLCNMKQVRVSQGTNTAADIHAFTEVPKAARAVGFTNNDLAAEFNVFSPNFGEKLAPAWIPVSFRDWAGKEIVRVYTDEFGSYNALLPSTFTANVPDPTGYSPNMITLVLNDPVKPDGTPDPFYNPTYSVTPWTFNYWPGRTSYLDTPLVPMTAFASTGTPFDSEPADLSPVISRVDAGPNAGPVICQTALPASVTIQSVGVQSVLNPNYIPGVSGTLYITRDFGFGTTTGSVTLNGTSIATTAWGDLSVTATVPLGATTGQMLLTRGDNSRRTEIGITLNIVDCATTTITYVDPNPAVGATPIQDAVDAAAAGHLIMVRPGQYNENVIMDRPIALQGFGAGSTFINANPNPIERLQAWHDRMNLLGARNFAAFLLKDPFVANEASAVAVLGEVEFPNGTLQNPLPGTQFLNAGNPFGGGIQAAVDGFTLTGSKAGGGAFAIAGARDLRISNNNINGNQGNFAGGITVGTEDIGFDSLNANAVLSYNKIHRNGSPQGAGGIGIYEGSHNYLVANNRIIGNLSRGNGGGIFHWGLSRDGVIRNNQVLFNENTFTALQAVAVLGNGGGIYVAGDVPGGTGSGSVTIDSNLVQGNLAGTGHGAGIMGYAINGLDVVDNPADPAQWYELKIVNNIVVNNVAALAGAGIYLSDVVSSKAHVYNNTVANNDSTATAQAAFAPGALNSTPQPSGIVTSVHSGQLQTILQAATPPLAETFSSPVLFNNIVWNNRSYFNDASLNAGTGGLAPNPTMPVWDLGVVDTLAPQFLSPAYSVLTALMNADGSNYSGSGNVAGNPLFVTSYTNALTSATVLDEGGNNITIRFTPLSQAGDYHIQSGSIARNNGASSSAGVNAPAVDFDNDSRAAYGAVDIGADEVPTLVPGSVTLNTPLAGATGVSTTPSYTWTIGASAGATQYILYVSNSGGVVRNETFSAAAICTGTTAVDTCTVPTTVPLASGVTHYWNVRGFNGTGYGPWAATRAFTTFTSATIPGAVTLDSPAAGATGVSTTPSYTWTVGASAGATQYTLYVSYSGGVVRNEVFSAASICTGTTAVDTCTVPTTVALLNGTRYYWNVRGFNIAGYGPWTSTRSFTVLP